MKRSIYFFIFLLTVGGCGSHATQNRDSDSVDADSPFEWKSVDPESMGLDGERLRSAVEYIQTEQLDITSMIVVKEGRIVLEYYADGDDEKTLYNIQSVTKSIVSTLVGIAIAERLIDGVDARVLDFFKERSFDNPSDDKSVITIADLLTMRSGLDYNNDEESFQNKADSIAFILNHPSRCAPGTEWAYSSADTQLLGGIITEKSEMSLEAYAKTRLFDKIGISPGAWIEDKGGLNVAGYGLSLTARDMARFGLFMLNNGEWEGERILSEKWVADSLTVAAETNWSRGDFGYSWWIKRFGGYCAGGRYGQQINVFPDRGLVVVYTAALYPMESADDTLDEITRAFVLGTLDVPEGRDNDAGVEDTCGSTAYEWIETSDLVRFGRGVYTFGDTVSTRCLHDVENRTACLRGRAANAGTNYTNWGAGMAVRLAEADETGSTVNPFNASAEGIAGVRFTLSGAETLRNALRAGMTMVNQDGIEYEYYGFIVHGGPAGDITANGEVVFTLADLGLPSWFTNLSQETPFDPTQVHALRFQVATQPGMSFDYDFCISNIEWLDEQGEPIAE